MLTYVANLRILVKVLIAPLLLVLCMLILTAIFQLGTNRQGMALTDLHDGAFRKYKVIAEVRTASTVVQSNLYRLLGWRSTGAKKDKIAELESQLRQDVARLAKAVAGLGDVQAKIEAFGDASIKVLDVSATDEVTALVMMVNTEQQYDALIGELRNLAETSDQETDETYRGAVGVAASSQATYYAVLAIFLVLGGAVSLGLARLIAGPVVGLTAVMARLAENATDVDVPSQDRRDEVGAMARTVEIFRINAIERLRMEARQRQELDKDEARNRAIASLTQSFDTAASEAIAAVASAAAEMTSVAQSMAANAEQTSRQTTTVAAATEQASVNVETVAAAAEELSSSIAEIGRQMERSSRASRSAAEEASHTDELVRGLAGAASRIGDVVKLINDIAGQTNLLALNATIEAARAGDAGKGFAVVAGEVKNLANQTAKATDEIAQQVSSVQEATRLTVEAIGGISQRIGEINGIASAIACSVEQQGAATHEIARNVQQAAAGTRDVASTIGEVTRAAGNTGAAAGHVLESARGLARRSEDIKRLVDQFLGDVRAV
ncbi:methyl-accepting chemotaxis protein [Magnetospirillum sp. 15-1]|uniref:methyl-accepting chemotaxis protein n=1 Tax=Magnetospirillum sp. 15-1 TaxID=1979370 RepID=UPI0014833F89|nr:methyl-accepting chemotaxis protein [Magnetospirillum sp. 15-1]